MLGAVAVVAAVLALLALLLSSWMSTSIFCACSLCSLCSLCCCEGPLRPIRLHRHRQGDEDRERCTALPSDAAGGAVY